MNGGVGLCWCARRAPAPNVEQNSDGQMVSKLLLWQRYCAYLDPFGKLLEEEEGRPDPRQRHGKIKLLPHVEVAIMVNNPVQHGQLLRNAKINKKRKEIVPLNFLIAERATRKVN